MGCSASKAKAKDRGTGGDGPEDQRQQEQGPGSTLLCTAKDADDELSLHPAAAVFRNEVLAGVGDDNRALEKRNSYVRHLRDFIQEIDITFYTDTYHTRPGDATSGGRSYSQVTSHKSFNVKSHLSQGSFKYVNDEERLVVPIKNTNSHPVDDSGDLGHVSVHLGKMSVGMFPTFMSNSALMEVGENGSVYVTLRLSEQVYIEGTLSASSSNESLLEYIENGNFMSYLQMPISPFALPFGLTPSQSKCITFTPCSIVITVTPWLRAAMALVNQSSTTLSSGCNVTELRRLVVTAIGGNEHEELLNKNLQLKHEAALLSKIRNFILRFDISHPGGRLAVSLDEGEELEDKERWVLRMNGKDNSAVTVAALGRMDISFSGVPLCLANGGMNVLRLARVFGNETRLAPLWMEFESFLLIGTFNWDDFTEEETSDILENFVWKMRNALGLTSLLAIGGVTGNDDVFPTTFKVNLCGILCDLSIKEGILKQFGLSENLTDE